MLRQRENLVVMMKSGRHDEIPNVQLTVRLKPTKISVSFAIEIVTVKITLFYWTYLILLKIEIPFQAQNLFEICL